MEFLVYKKFYEQHRVETLTQILKENNIEFEVGEERESLDSLYGDKHLKDQFSVKLKGEDFLKADAILLSLSEKELNNVESDHYLFGFTDDELFDILSKPDEWNEFDYQLAKKILNERGKEINPEVIALLKKQRTKDLSKPEERQKAWIYIGYFFSLIGVFILIGGIVGVFIGWHLATHKKVLPNGQVVYGYTKLDRRHGRAIWILGCVAFAITVFIRFSNLE